MLVPGFPAQISGDRFTPDARIYFNQSEMPTTFVNAEKVVTDIPANLIAQEGPRQVIVQRRTARPTRRRSCSRLWHRPGPTSNTLG